MELTKRLQGSLARANDAATADMDRLFEQQAELTRRERELSRGVESIQVTICSHSRMLSDDYAIKFLACNFHAFVIFICTSDCTDPSPPFISGILNVQVHDGCTGGEARPGGLCPGDVGQGSCAREVAGGEREEAGLR